MEADRTVSYLNGARAGSRATTTAGAVLVPELTGVASEVLGKLRAEPGHGVVVLLAHPPEHLHAVGFPVVSEHDRRGAEPLPMYETLALLLGPHHFSGLPVRQATLSHGQVLHLAVALEDVAADPDVTPDHPPVVERKRELRLDVAHAETGDQDATECLEHALGAGIRERNGGPGLPRVRPEEHGFHGQLQR